MNAPLMPEVQRRTVARRFKSLVPAKLRVTEARAEEEEWGRARCLGATFTEWPCCRKASSWLVRKARDTYNHYDRNRQLGSKIRGSQAKALRRKEKKKDG